MKQIHSNVDIYSSKIAEMYLLILKDTLSFQASLVSVYEDNTELCHNKNVERKTDRKLSFTYVVV